MPDYRRFIAYFYEYIEGKRRRNAGFVKAEQRNGIWRLRIQLRGENWPGESLQIFGFMRDGEEYPTLQLGKGYPGKDSMIQTLQLRVGGPGSDGPDIGQLSGMWIPCGAGRCFLSNWEETEVDVDRLRLPMVSGVEEAGKANEPRRVADGGQDGNDNVGEEPLREELPEIAETGGGDPHEKRTETVEAETRGIEIGEAKTGEIKTGEAEAGKLETREAEIRAKETRETETGEAETRGTETREAENRVKETRKTETGGTETGETDTEEGTICETERQVEAMECISPDQTEKTEAGGAVFDEQKRESGEENRKAMENAWQLLAGRSQRVSPFVEENGEYIRICPRDVRWLGQQRWPVGQNSFLIQGFYQYRHLLLGRKEDGTYILAVPGRETQRNHAIAASFGFDQFRLVEGGRGFPEGFGYWYREI